MSDRELIIAAIGLACVIGRAEAQLLPSPAQAGFPNITSISAENAAGLLSYCVKNRLLSADGSKAVESALMRKPGLSTSSGYALGETGHIISGTRAPMTFADIPSSMRKQACDAVLKRGSVLLAQRKP